GSKPATCPTQNHRKCKTMTKPLALVAGAGNGLGNALLKQFQNNGFNVVGIGRSQPARDQSTDYFFEKHAELQGPCVSYRDWLCW
ncbi:MAG: hypothetical protein ABJQ70_12845, partial [Roseobacter sp.]